ncbi:PDR/VanB family oxidoreductase [Mycobacterium yunnanensis]|uniref:PDR/VanB family oxidoreductase n=1 Tax=Mycobacterium yunnanensis TaxID=368477 RepID=UPI0021F2E474|nr:PDR/VanB family oxidoreductase [Mycobacterium yunnanensis]
MGVTSYELSDPDGVALPGWSPGAHIDVHLPSGMVRQYSLCGDVADRTHYRIAVLELPTGRGGSAEAHRELRPGAIVATSMPRSAFTLVEADRYLFVAGGIGITPILPMIREVDRAGLPWELTYCARSVRHFSFVEELHALGPDRVRFLAEDVDGRPDLGALARGSHGAAVFCCGPAGLMDGLTAHMRVAGRDDVHLERFTPPSAATGLGGFAVELARSGIVLEVPDDRTVLEAVRAIGVDVDSSCEMGMCGTCETKVLEGTVDHRDELLTEAEKAAGTTMLICVSRAACPKLVLDL